MLYSVIQQVARRDPITYPNIMLLRNHQALELVMHQEPEVLFKRSLSGAHGKIPERGSIYGLIRTGALDSYIILDFTISKPKKRRPE